MLADSSQKRSQASKAWDTRFRMAVADVKTAQRSMRHAKATTMLDHYAQTDMDELIAAQELVLDAIFSHAGGAVQ
jgi:hypothetical protein